MDRYFKAFGIDLEREKRRCLFHSRDDVFRLSSYERLAVWCWSMSLHPIGRLNAKLRTGEALGDDEWGFIGLLDQALERIPSCTRDFVFRGVTYANDKEQISADFARGTEHVWESFTSSAMDEKHAFTGNLLMLVQQRSGRPIMLYSEDYFELEVLFPRGTLLVSEGGWRREGQHVVLLRETD